jgi:hypothetical protein
VSGESQSYRIRYCRISFNSNQLWRVTQKLELRYSYIGQQTVTREKNCIFGMSRWAENLPSMRKRVMGERIQGMLNWFSSNSTFLKVFEAKHAAEAKLNFWVIFDQLCDLFRMFEDPLGDPWHVRKFSYILPAVTRYIRIDCNATVSAGQSTILGMMWQHGNYPMNTESRHPPLPL